MKLHKRIFLGMHAFWELFRYDVVAAVFGFPGIYATLRRTACRGGPSVSDAEEAVSRAVACMSSFYWKPVLCLHRSVVTARLLRIYGVKAEVVIGYRATPFISHAWVEVNGRILNDYQGYQQKLGVLERI